MSYLKRFHLAKVLDDSLCISLLAKILENNDKSLKSLSNKHFFYLDFYR